MTNQRRPASCHSSRALLNDLIVACYDGARAQMAASRIVGGPERRWRLEDGAGRRRAFAAEIAEVVRTLGGAPVTGGSTLETVRAAAHWVDSLFVGDNGGDAYASCARIEAKAERLYERAMSANLPAPTRSIIERHLAEISSDRAELRRLSMGG